MRFVVLRQRRLLQRAVHRTESGVQFAEQRGVCRPVGEAAPAASQTGLIALCVLLAAVGIGSLISVRYRRHS